MTATVMPKQSKSSRKQALKPKPENQAADVLKNLDPAVQKIIDKARSAPVRAPAIGAVSLCGLTSVLLWASFTPLNWGPLGWLALVPLLVLVRIHQRTSSMYAVSYGMGFVWAVATLQWMRLGHWTMHFALLALSSYVAIYFPVFLAVTRTAVHRLRIPLVVAAPVVWVGLEFLRAHLLTGFSWYYLGHTQWWWTEMIQVSDLTGAYGISFVVAMAAATIAMLLPDSIFDRLKLVPPTTSGPKQSGFVRSGHPWWMTACTLAVFAATLGYGFVRRSQADFQPGPQVALIQGNITPEVKHGSDLETVYEILQLHDQMTGYAVKQQPDLIVWPETMFPFAMLETDAAVTDAQLAAALQGHPELATQRQRLFEQWRSGEVRNRLADDARKANAALMIGVTTKSLDAAGTKTYNSAVFLHPELGYEGRYDKLHRVIFGEYIPLKETLPLLQMFSPYGSEFGIEAGEVAKVFEYRGWNFAPIICFEDTVPQLVRGIADRSIKAGTPVDCFVNHTNDGWFHGSSELDQHLITAAFRSVETRTPMVRAVNTGISAFIDGDGVIRDPELFYDFDKQAESTARTQSGAWKRQMNAVVIANVPLDNRSSLYVRYGDWFGITCCFLAVFAAFAGLMLRGRTTEA